MQPQSNNSASRNNKQYNHQHQQPTGTTTTGAAASAASTTATGSSSTVVQSANSLAQRRTPVKILKSKKPLCQFKFYLDICDHQLTKRIEEQIKVLGGVLEFFLNASVTHFITDKSTQPPTNSSQPATPQTPATPGTPQTPYSLELQTTTANDAGTPLNTATKRTRTSRADAILNKARRQSQTATPRPPVAASVAQATSTGLQQQDSSQLPYIVWQTEYALRFFKKVHIELRQYLEVPKVGQKATINNNNSTATPTNASAAYTCRTKFIEPISLKGNYIKIEPIKRQFRPYYQLFKKPIEWPRIDLKRDDGAFRLSPRKPNTEEPTTPAKATPQQPLALAAPLQQTKPEKPPPTAAAATKMTRKSRSRSSQHRPLPASVQALKKQTLVESPKASAPAIQRTAAAKDLLLTPNNKVESSDKQCGVCEICKIEYDTLSVHLKSKDHEFFAKNSQNFIALDTLINASADVSQFLADNEKKMELEEMEVVDEETNTEASALDPLNATPTLGLMEGKEGGEQKRRSSGAYKTPSPTLREKSKRITKGKHSSEKFQKTDYAASTMTTTTTTTGGLGTRSSPLKGSRSPEKRHTSSILAEQAAAREESRKAATARKRPQAILPLSPPARPPMLPASPLYKVVETTEMRTPKRRIRMGAGGEETHLVDSPSLIVKFQKVRTTELERLNGEAESFMFRKHAANTSSELPTDQDRQTTSDVLRSGGARGSQSSLSMDSSTSDVDMDIENLEQLERRGRGESTTVLAPKAIAIAKRRKVAATTDKCRQSFPDAPIQPDIQLSTSRTTTTSTSHSSRRPAAAPAASSFAFPEATRKSSRTATAIVTAATTSSLLQAAVDAARLNSRRRRTAPAVSASMDEAETVEEPKTAPTTSRTRRTLVKLEDRMGDTPSNTSNKTSNTSNKPLNTSNKPSNTPKIPTNMNPRIKIKIERHTPTPSAAPTPPPTLFASSLAAPPPARQSAKAAINRCASLELLSYAFIDDDEMEEDEEESIDNDDLNDKDFKVRKRNRKPTMKAAAAARSAANSKRLRRAVTVAPSISRIKAAQTINIKQEVLSEVEPEEEEVKQQETDEEEAHEQAEEEEDDENDAESHEEGNEDEEAERVRREKLAAKIRKRRRARLGSKPRRKKRPAPRKLEGILKTEPRSSSNETKPKPKEVVKEEKAVPKSSPTTANLSSPRSCTKRLTKDQSSTSSTPRSSPEKPLSGGKSRNKQGATCRLFDYTQSEHIQSLQYSFERLPSADHWYRVFDRQDAGREKYHEYFGSTKYRKLPYELGPIPFDMTLNCVNCRLCKSQSLKEEKPKESQETAKDTKATTKTEAEAIAEDPKNENVKSKEETKKVDRENAYLLKHKKLHLLQRYRQEQQELLQQHADKATQVDEEVKPEPEEQLNPASLNSTAALTATSTSTTTTLSSSKASTPDLENSSQAPGQRKRAGSTHSTASSCASSSATLNKKPFRNKHLNRAALLSLELPPRKSPREHASTLALVSCIIRQRQDSLSKNNSEVEDEPGTPTELQPAEIKKEEQPAEADVTHKMNGDAAEEELELKLKRELDHQLQKEAEAERRRKEQQELDEQAARVAQRERTPPPAPSTVEQHHPALSPRTTRSTAATPIEEMRFATEISETVKRMRRGQNKYDHSPPFAEPSHRNASATKSQAGGSTAKTPARSGPLGSTPSPAGSQSNTPRKRGRPPKDKCAAMAKLSMSILPYTRRGLHGSLHDRSSSNRSNTPNSNRSSAMMLHRNSAATNSSSANSFKQRRGRPSVLHKIATYNSTHSNGYGLSPAIRKTGSKKGVIEYDVDMSALKALEIATQHKNVRHLEWEIDKYLQLACKDYGDEVLSLDPEAEMTEDSSRPAETRIVDQPEVPPIAAQTPPPTDYFSSDFDLCDLLGNSAQIVGACAGMDSEAKGKAYSVYSAVAFENYFKKRRSMKKNRTGWPSTQKRKVLGSRDQRKPHLRGSRRESKDSQKSAREVLAKEELAEDAEKPKKKVGDVEEEEEDSNDLKASKSLRESEDDEAGVITPPDSEAEEDECDVEDAERLSAKTTASLRNAEDYEGAESTELYPAETLMQDRDLEETKKDLRKISSNENADEEAEDHEEVFADAEGDADPPLEEDEEDDAETMVDSIAETCTQDLAGIEADEEDALDDDDEEEDEDDEDELEHADMVTINNDDNAQDDDDDEDEADDDREDDEEGEENDAADHEDAAEDDDDDAEMLRDELDPCIDDNAQLEADRGAFGEVGEPIEADEDGEETYEEAVDDSVQANGVVHDDEDEPEDEQMEVVEHDNEQLEAHKDDELVEEDEVEAEVAQVTANSLKVNSHNSFLAAFGGLQQKKSPSTATASGSKSIGSSSSKRTRHPKATTAPSTTSPNHSTPLKSNIASSATPTPPNHHLLRALRRTPQLNGSLGSCISPTEKAGDSDIFTVSSDGLDTDLDLSNQHAQLRSGAALHHDDEAANECPHHSSSSTTITTPRRRLDITKYAPKSSGSTCAAEAATAAVKSLAISQFLKKEVRVTCRRIRAPFRRFRFRR